MFITGDCHKYYECYGTPGIHDCPENQGYTNTFLSMIRKCSILKYIIYIFFPKLN